MPLAFASKSHGTIAFGFFNIQTDMLLLEELFFFADRFCRAVPPLLSGDDPQLTTSLQAWQIERGAIGDLHGAIAGVNHSGFIGETYRRWPFPSDLSGFKQQPEGVETQREIEEMIASFGSQKQIVLTSDHKADAFYLNDYQFDEAQFMELVDYVDRGGYPRWRDDLRPGYVREMMRAIRR